MVIFFNIITSDYNIDSNLVYIHGKNSAALVEIPPQMIYDDKNCRRRK